MKYLTLILPLICLSFHQPVMVVEKTPQPTWGYTLFKLSTPFFVPPKIGSGDRDFGGNGPNVTCNVTLSISPDKRSLLATVNFHAKETKSDWTECGGSATYVIFNCGPFKQTLVSINSPTTSSCSYTDNDHDEDFITGGGHSEIKTQAQNSDWALVGMDTRNVVAFFRCMGDDNGDDAGTKAGVQVFFNPIDVTMSGNGASEVMLNVPGAPTCGNNTCASSASTAFLNFYHVSGITCDHMRMLFQDTRLSPNVSSYVKALSGNNIGVDPNTVRDRLKEIKHDVVMEEINSPAVMDRIKAILSSGKPVIPLTGWGSKTVRDFYCRSDDNVSANPNSVLHYIVVDGFNRETNVFHVVDNGTPKFLSQQYLQNIILWHPENFAIEGALYGSQVKPGKIIY